MKLSLSPLFFSLSALSFVSAGTWCGKPYAAVRHTPVPPDPNGNPNPVVITTVKPGFGAQFRFEPYLSSDSAGSLVVNVPKGGSYQVAASLADGTSLLAATNVPPSDSVQEIVGVDLTKLTPQLQPFNLTIAFASSGASVQTITTMVYRLPAGPKTVRVDRLYGTIIPSNSQSPIFPFGPYVDFGWIDPAGTAASIQSNLQTLKSLGFNIINPDPTFTDLGAMDELLQICETLGIYVQVSFRYDYHNITEVTQRVQRWMNYSAVLTWYTADEPDGTQWTATAPTVSAYQAVKATDPYKPVAMLLNCQNVAGYYTTSTDIFGTDMYPIGINTTGCTTNAGDCGCDECTGSIAPDFAARQQKYWSDFAAQGLQATPVWMGLQAFSDPTTWWSRAPTPQELTAMFYITVTEGYKGITFWKYPLVPDNTLQNTLSSLASQLLALSPYLTGFQQIPASHITLPGNSTSPTLFAGAWANPGMSSMLVIVVNAAATAAPFSVTISGASNLTLTGKDLTGAAVQIKAGVFSGQLTGLGVEVATFGTTVAPSSQSLPGGSSMPTGTGASPSSTSSTSKSKSSTVAVGWRMIATLTIGIAGLLVIV